MSNIIQENYSYHTTGLKFRENNKTYYICLKKTQPSNHTKETLTLLPNPNHSSFIRFDVVNTHYENVEKNSLSSEERHIVSFQRKILKDQIFSFPFEFNQMGQTFKKIVQLIQLDKKFIFEWVKESDSPLNVFGELINDQQIAIERIKRDPELFHALPSNLKETPSFVCHVLCHHPQLAQRNVLKPFSLNGEFFISLIERSANLNFLAFASENLLCKEIFLENLIEIIEKENRPITFTKQAPLVIRDNICIMRLLIKKDIQHLNHASYKIRTNSEVANEFFVFNPNSLSFFSSCVTKNTNFSGPLLKKDGLLMELMPTKVKKNSLLAEIAVSQNPKSFKALDHTLQNDASFFLKLYEKNPQNELLEQIPNEEVLSVFLQKIKLSFEQIEIIWTKNKNLNALVKNKYLHLTQN